MARSPERTRSQLLAAATEEFSANGFAGARVARIAERAGVNVERLYSHFGDKRALFEAVLTDQLIERMESIPIEGQGPEAIGAFAERFFDSLQARPGLPRLLAWEGLELSDPVDLALRSARAAARSRELSTTLGCSEEEARWLLLDLVTMCYSWQVLPNLARIITGAPAADNLRRSHLHAAAVALASSYAAATAT